MHLMQSDSPKDVDDSFLAGKLLVATPSIGDPRFDRSVILMCDHSAEHAMGIVLNKPIDGRTELRSHGGFMRQYRREHLRGPRYSLKRSALRPRQGGQSAGP